MSVPSTSSVKSNKNVEKYIVGPRASFVAPHNASFQYDYEPLKTVFEYNIEIIFKIMLKYPSIPGAVCWAV